MSTLRHLRGHLMQLRTTVDKAAQEFGDLETERDALRATLRAAQNEVRRVRAEAEAPGGADTLSTVARTTATMICERIENVIGKGS